MHTIKVSCVDPCCLLFNFPCAHKNCQINKQCLRAFHVRLTVNTLLIIKSDFQVVQGPGAFIQARLIKPKSTIAPPFIKNTFSLFLKEKKPSPHPINNEHTFTTNAL